MKKKLAILMTSVLVLMLALPLAMVSAANGGLLNGQRVNFGSSIDNAQGGTTLDVTDNSLSSAVTLGANFGNNTLWYKFSTPKTINFYMVNANTGILKISFYDANKQVLSTQTASSPGSKVSVSPISNVTYVAVYHATTNTSLYVTEMDVWGADSTPNYSGGLLDTVGFNRGSDLNDIKSSDLKQATDNDEATNISLSAAGTDNAVLWYRFSSPVNIDKYQLKSSSNLVYLYFYNASNQIIYSATSTDLNINGVRTSISLISNVSAVTIKNRNSTSMNISEFNVFGSIADPDSTPPAAPTGFVSTASDVVNGTYSMSWAANTESDMKEYQLWQNGVLLVTLPKTKTSYTASGLQGGQTYQFVLKAVDTSGNVSANSETLTFSMPVPDTTPPSAPSGLSGTAGTDQVTLTWLAPPDADLDSYNVYQNGVLIKSNIKDSSYKVDGLKPDTLYRFTVRAVDRAGNESTNSNPLSIRTLLKPTTVPINLTAKARNKSVTLNWDAVDDATEYQVYRNDEKLATTSETTYTDEAVENGTIYAYRISSVIEGQESELSNVVQARPGAQLELEPPSGGGGGGSPNNTMDVVKTAFSFLDRYKLYVLLILGLIVSPSIIGFVIWLFRKMKPKQDIKQPKQRQPLSPEEKERRARDRKLNQARDDKYELLTRQGRITERDRWVKESNYLNREQRQAKAREERNQKAREARAAAKASNAGRTSREGRTGRTSSRSQRTGRGGRKGGR